MARSMNGLILTALMGVVTNVTTTPCCAHNLAMSAIGIRWPGDINGIRTK